MTLSLTKSLRKKSPYSELFWSAFSRIFPAFSLIRTEYGEILVSRENAGKVRTRITPNADTFYAVNGRKDKIESIIASMYKTLGVQMSFCITKKKLEALEKRR